MEKTFEEIAKLESGTILHDEFDEGIRFIINRGPAAICAYKEVKDDSWTTLYEFKKLMKLSEKIDRRDRAMTKALEE